ncbi:MAG: hypothetical protein V3V84_08370 [Candidatus Bathyarchaeia archaeon]
MGVVDPSGGLTPDEGGGAAGWVEIASVDVASATSGLLESVFTDSFDKYAITGRNLTLSDRLVFRVAVGTTINSGDEYYMADLYAGVGNNPNNNGSDQPPASLSFMQFVNLDMSGDPDETTNFNMDVDRVDSDTFHFTWRGGYMLIGAAWATVQGAGFTRNPHDGIQFLGRLGGTFGSGLFTVYGVA